MANDVRVPEEIAGTSFPVFALDGSFDPKSEPVNVYDPDVDPVTVARRVLVLEAKRSNGGIVGAECQELYDASVPLARAVLALAGIR